MDIGLELRGQTTDHEPKESVLNLLSRRHSFLVLVTVLEYPCERLLDVIFPILLLEFRPQTIGDEGEELDLQQLIEGDYVVQLYLTEDAMVLEERTDLTWGPSAEVLNRHSKRDLRIVEEAQQLFKTTMELLQCLFVLSSVPSLNSFQLLVETILKGVLEWALRVLPSNLSDQSRLVTINGYQLQLVLDEFEVLSCDELLREDSSGHNLLNPSKVINDLLTTSVSNVAHRACHQHLWVLKVYL